MITSEDASNFFVNGFVHGSIKEAIDIDFDQFDFVDCLNYKSDRAQIDSRAGNVLTLLRELIEDRYIRPLFPQFNLHEQSMWQGVDELSADWHNDLALNGKFNSNVLLYLDDSLGKNNIAVRNGTETHVIWPQRGDIVWLNQNKEFEHKATHVAGRRRLLSFEYFIPGLVKN